MLPEVREYLKEIRFHLRLEPRTTEQVIEEMHTHIEDKLSELEVSGSSEKDAARQAIMSFGQAEEIARLTNTAFSQGSWNDAGMAALPHLAIACLFASHLWRNAPVAYVAIALIVLVTLIGWRHGRPKWIYTWTGYSLMPFVIAMYLATLAILSRIATSGLDWGIQSWGPMFILLCAGVGFFGTAVLVIKKDWLQASLMMLPVPSALCWLLALKPAGESVSNISITGAPFQIDSPVAVTCLILAIFVVVFIRLRNREVKLATLIAAGTISLPFIAHRLWNNLGFFVLVFLALVATIVLLIPNRLEAILGHE